MGQPEVSPVPCNSADVVRKTSIESKAESSPEMDCTNSPPIFDSVLDKNFLNKLVEVAYFRPMPMFPLADVMSGTRQMELRFFHQCARMYFDSLMDGKFGPVPFQNQNALSSNTGNDNHFNLSLLADVAFSHRSHDDDNNIRGQLTTDGGHKMDDDCAPVNSLKCKRIRNNEACRKSRLRRKLLNAAAKEKLVSLTHDNDILKRKIVSLEEEVKAAKDALLTRMRVHPFYNQNPESMFDSLWYTCEELTKAYQRERDGRLPLVNKCHS